jgi:hypothetical protein
MGGHLGIGELGNPVPGEFYHIRSSGGLEREAIFLFPMSWCL